MLNAITLVQEQINMSTWNNCFCYAKWVNHFLVVINSIHIYRQIEEEIATGKRKGEKLYLPT